LAIPPSAAAELTVAQLDPPPLDPGVELAEQPAASNASAATPIRVKRQGDLTHFLRSVIPNREQAAACRQPAVQ
jgi:hypothetical protein